MCDIIEKPVPPEIDGYLTKLKRKQSLFGSWTKRYFRVNMEEERIEYFKLKQQSQDSSYSTGHIDLWDISNIRKFDGNSFQIEAGPSVMLVKADSAAETACWVNGLLGFVEQRKAYERHQSLTKGYYRVKSRNRSSSFSKQ